MGPAEGPRSPIPRSPAIFRRACTSASWCLSRARDFGPRPRRRVSWTAAGSKQVTVTNIPIGPANVVQRLLAFTAEGGASFYHVPDSMVIDDNTTTSLTVDFSDTILLAGVSMDYLFAQIELPDQLGVIDYAERLFWWGERSKMDAGAISHSMADGIFRQRAAARLDARSHIRRGRQQGTVRRDLGRRVSHHRRRRHFDSRTDFAKRRSRTRPAIRCALRAWIIPCARA